jgi:hypothetical protein
MKKICATLMICFSLSSPIALGQKHCFWDKTVLNFNDNILENFDGNTLPLGVKVKEKLKILSTGLPEITSTDSNGSKIDAFQCEQSIWETAPFFSSVGEDTPEFSCYFGYRTVEKSNECNQFSSPNFVVLHVIPRGVLRRYPGVFTEAQIHSKTNLVLLSVKNLQSPDLKAFRKDWCEFFRKNTTLSKEALSSEDKLVRTKYSNLFQPIK